MLVLLRAPEKSAWHVLSLFFCYWPPRNIFDFVIVALSAVETALDLFAKTIASEMFGSDALSVVRTLRLARALRGFRAFRLVRHFSALRALILSIVSTIGSLMWLGPPVVPFCPCYLGVSLLKPNIRKKGYPYY